jgi:biotin transport system permease protein
MLRYEPGATVLHRLDPRSKLTVQFGFAFAVFTADSPPALVAATVLAGLVLALGRLSPVRVLRTFRFVLLLVGLAPLFAMGTFGPPWLVPARALPSIVAGYQVILILFVSSVYVRTTPIRETRAAIQRHVPGKPGQLLGVGVGLVFRFFPVIWQDIQAVQAAMKTRGGDERSAIDRTRRLTLAGLRRVFERADRLSLALRARCFAWNPTLPVLEPSRLDYLVSLFGLGLALAPLAGLFL